jgi:hypothetical protein
MAFLKLVSPPPPHPKYPACGLGYEIQIFLCKKLSNVRVKQVVCANANLANSIKESTQQTEGK